MSRDPEQGFEEHVATRFRLYSGLFLGLPYDLLQRVGRLLPVFAEHCRKELQQKKSPSEIVDGFFVQNPALTDVSQSDAVFLFLQLIEREVVLFDALEDASFSKIHDLDAPGSVTHLLDVIFRDDRRADLASLLGQTATRIVLTAHPTQFYPDTIQGIIQDLRPALNRNDPAEVERLLLQLGKTRFSNPERPTPVDEARSILHGLDDVFYETLSEIAGRMLVSAYGRMQLPQSLPKHPNLQIGFWPGGDRDGNPFVTADVTREVARLLKERVLEHHLRTARQLARHLTFEGVHTKVQAIVARLRTTWLAAADDGADMGTLERLARIPPYASATELQSELLELRKLIIREHQSLFLDQLDDFIVKVHLFGFHFASLDLRQASDVFFATLRELVGNLGDLSYLRAADHLAINKAESAQELPFELLERMLRSAKAAPSEILAGLSPLARDTLTVLGLVADIQRSNGELGLHRVVISHTRGPEDPMVVLVLAAFAGLSSRSASLDIVPLFESIQDLESSEAIMSRLLESHAYRDVLAGRTNRQVVMMGFSDGTKDGGYLTANWSIRRAKRRLSQLGRSHGVRIIFFDGRGGPPARGGGNTHRFYRSRDSAIEQWETQLTIQGQTISSNFGSHDMARYHIEQLYTANIENLLDEGPWEGPSYPPRSSTAELNSPVLTRLDEGPREGPSYPPRSSTAELNSPVLTRLDEGPRELPRATAAEPSSSDLTRPSRTPGQDPPPEFIALIDELSALSMEAYAKLRDNPLLLEFLADRSPLPLFEHLTNGSRPASRRASKAIELESLRAIPFVATWSVLKIQISGFYGLGSALDHVIASGREADLQRLYRSSRFFRALLDNAAMSLLKSRFDITAHLKRDERFSGLWTQIRDEAARVERCILRITHQPWLLANDPLIRASIRYREEIILPLLVIVHDAFARYHDEVSQGKANTPKAVQARRMALKGIAAVINATRNAA